MATIKEPIKLRQRERRNGRIALYLDIYHKGRRRQESLNLYLLPEHSRADKEENRKTLALAEAIKAQRLVEFRNRRYQLNDPAIASPYLLDYFGALIERKTNDSTVNTLKSWVNVYKQLEQFLGDNKPTLEDVDKYLLADFIDYLIEDTSVNTARVYISKITAALHQAVADGLLMRNPMEGVKLPKATQTHREALSIEEVRRIAAAECSNDIAKRAFLFSCLTGLRRSDVLALRWGDVRKVGDMTRIVFEQQKTRALEYLDISPQAVQYMGSRKRDNERVFDVNAPQCTYALRQLCANAGINRKITFHCGRHTFAVLMLDLGADIYTVQKLLGHKSIETTQIYAKMLDKRKQEAVLRIPEI